MRLLYSTTSLALGASAHFLIHTVLQKCIDNQIQSRTSKACLLATMYRLMKTKYVQLKRLLIDSSERRFGRAASIFSVGNLRLLSLAPCRVSVGKSLHRHHRQMATPVKKNLFRGSLFAKNTQWIFYPSTLGKYQLDVCYIVIFAIMKLVLLIMHQNQS